MLVGPLIELLGVPTTCPPATVSWRVVVGTGGHGRLLAEAFEVADDVGVLAVDHVLVPERGGRLTRDRCGP